MTTATHVTLGVEEPIEECVEGVEPTAQCGSVIRGGATTYQ